MTFQLVRGLTLALYPRGELAKDAECRTPPGRRWEGIATPGSTRRSPALGQLMVNGAEAATSYGVVLFLFNWTR